MASKAKVAVQLTLEGASQVARGMGMITGTVKGMGDGISAAGANLFHFLQIGKDVYGFAQRMAGAMRDMGQALLEPNAAFEKSQVSFEVLLGSVDLARERIELLYEYANSTPFLNPDVVKAGKLLESFGGEALGTGDNLIRTGDLAAFTELQMAEMAQTVGRLWGAIQGGQPLGDAATRMRELGILTGQQVTALTELNNEAETAEEVWDAFIKMTDKYEGMAARQAETMDGAVSTIQGLWGEVKRLTGVRLFDTVKQDVIGIRDDLSHAFDTDQIQVFADKVGAAIAGMYEGVKNTLLGDLKITDLLDAAEAGTLHTLIWSALKTAGENFWIFLVNSARIYGPQLVDALTKDFPALRKLLGVDQLAAMRKAAAGTATEEDMEDIGFFTMANKKALEVQAKIKGQDFTQEQYWQAMLRYKGYDEGPEGRVPLEYKQFEVPITSGTERAARTAWDQDQAEAVRLGIKEVATPFEESHLGRMYYKEDQVRADENSKALADNLEKASTAAAVLNENLEQAGQKAATF